MPMKSELQGQLFKAIYACLRPLARFLIRSGVTYKQFADLAKLAFVEEAYLDIDSRGRRGNDSRVATKTGVSRKEIKRIRDFKRANLGDIEWLGDKTFAAPARVLHLWNFDPAYTDGKGEPLPLSFDVGERSFTSLVKKCAGDIPPGAVRAELLQAGAIVETDDGLIKALKSFYIPQTLDEKTLSTLSMVLFPVAAGIAHNLRPDRPTQGYIQRFAYSDSLTAESLAEFRGWAREKAATFVTEVDYWLAQNESDATSDSVRSSTAQHAGLGVYYYEGPSIGDALEPTESR
jgi:hypothetical protein